MGQEDIQESFRLIDANIVSSDFVGPAPLSLVQKAETVLGFRLPEAYRLFVQRYGAGDILGLEFFGLLGPDFKNSGIPDAVWLTLKERQDSGLPPGYVIVYMEGDGTYDVLDCTRGPDAESPVLAMPPGEPVSDTLETVAPDFGAFMREKLESVL